MAGASRTIGRVLEMLRPEFPDISVSKLRYLEAEGLVSPERQQPSGYRRFAAEDVDRLVYVLRAQRDRYLPLKVIRDELEAIDRGEDPATATEETVEQPAVAEVRRVVAPSTSKGFTRRQVMEASGIGEGVFVQLERSKLVEPRRGTQLYGPESVAIAVAAKKLAGYGMDVRQLRVLQQAAVMEAAVIEKALEPHRRRTGSPQEVVSDLYRVVLQAHAALLQRQFL